MKEKDKPFFGAGQMSVEKDKTITAQRILDSQISKGKREER